MSRAKKVIAAMLVGVMLFGLAATAYAADSVRKAPEHVCSFSVVSYSCYNSFSSGTHSYVSGWKVDGSTGETKPVYSTCTILVNQYKGVWRCACGATNGLDYKTETQHTKCGQ